MVLDPTTDTSQDLMQDPPEDTYPESQEQVPDIGLPDVQLYGTAPLYPA